MQLEPLPFGADAIYARNRELSEQLAGALAAAGWMPVAPPAANRSTIVSVPLGDTAPEPVVAALRDRGVVCSARDGNRRLAIHCYNDEDDIDRVARALDELTSARTAARPRRS